MLLLSVLHLSSPTFNYQGSKSEVEIQEPEHHFCFPPPLLPIDAFLRFKPFQLYSTDCQYSLAV